MAHIASKVSPILISLIAHVTLPEVHVANLSLGEKFHFENFGKHLHEAKISAYTVHDYQPLTVHERQQNLMAILLLQNYTTIPIQSILGSSEYRCDTRKSIACPYFPITDCILYHSPVFTRS